MPPGDATPLTKGGEAADERRGSTADATPCTDGTAWVELELVGEDGTGLADHRYVLTLPDGSTREGKTDSDGLARIEGIAAKDGDTCSLTFPDLDRAAWEPASSASAPE